MEAVRWQWCVSGVHQQLFDPQRATLIELLVSPRQRALNQSPLVAGQVAGLNYDRRNLFRVEKKPVVAARIAWLSRQDEEALREKRKRLEEALWGGLYADRADFYETVETPITDRNGHAVLKPNGEP